VPDHSLVSDDAEEQISCPVEFLNSLKLLYMVSYKLILKVSIVIILLRELNTFGMDLD
jgi:hypothetical protein